jgi:hypothetical protein
VKQSICMRCSKHCSKLRLQLSTPGARQETSAEDKIRQASDIDFHCRRPELCRRNEMLLSFLHLAFERNCYSYFPILILHIHPIYTVLSTDSFFSCRFKISAQFKPPEIQSIERTNLNDMSVEDSHVMHERTYLRTPLSNLPKKDRLY